MALAHLDPQVQIKLLDIATRISVPGSYVKDEVVIKQIAENINMAYKELVKGTKEAS